MLFWISLKLLAPVEQAHVSSKATAPDGVLRAVSVIAIADFVRSLDNVIAVAAAANGKFAMLMFGLGVSVPIIVAGATVIMTMINYFPLIVWRHNCDRFRRHRRYKGIRTDSSRRDCSGLFDRGGGRNAAWRVARSSRKTAASGLIPGFTLRRCVRCRLLALSGQSDRTRLCSLLE